LLVFVRCYKIQH